MIRHKTKLAILFLFLAFHSFIFSPAYAAFQTAVDGELLEKAENFYYDGDFDNAIKAANQYLSQANLSKPDKMNAFKLLTHIFLAKNDAPSAKKVVELILDIEPSYAPTLEEETPKYVTFVTEVKKQYTVKKVKPQSKKINWLVWGGAGAAATLLVILVAGGGSDGSGNKPLPLPPDLPK